jgi:predicted esterase
MHGGGFKFGSKKARGIPEWSKTFAQRGYTCAAINYRKSKKKPIKRFADLAAGCYQAIQDLDQAITFFKINNQYFGIDTGRIILAGNSAGAMIAIQAVYSNPESLSKLSGDTGNIVFKYANNFSNIAGIINFWGAIFDTSMLHTAIVPIVSVHGTKDAIVPYKQKDVPLYGSYYIQKQATAIGIPNDLKSYEGYAHELQKHFNPIVASGATKRRWLEAGQFASDFLYQQLFR